jgi:hypothetical protein
MRKILRHIVLKTNELNAERLGGDYLRPFHSRELPGLIKMQQRMTFQFECFYKNLNDPAGINDIESLIQL